MHFTGTLYRALNPYWARRALSGEGAALHGGRFNARGTPALYCSLAPETALREANQIGPLQPTTMVSFAADLDPVFDATGFGALAPYGLAGADLGDDLWRARMADGAPVPTQDLAAALIAEGYAGLIAPSFAPAALPGDLNMVLWRWGDALPCRLVLNDRDGRLARPPADPA
ncbi:MAG: RES domain-containing protein [Paracoccaceae bacterium]|nr:RES domain-containing protein [Maritimibacter sp.]